MEKESAILMTVLLGGSLSFFSRRIKFLVATPMEQPISIKISQKTDSQHICETFMLNMIFCINIIYLEGIYKNNI